MLNFSGTIWALYDGFIFTAGLLCCCTWSRMGNRMKAAAGIVLLCLIVETARIALSGIRYTNEVLLNLVPLLEFLLVLRLYSRTVPVTRHRVRLYTILWLLLSLSSILAVQLIKDVQSNLYNFEAIAISAMSIHALYWLAVSSNERRLVSHPLFWIWSGLLIYNTATLGFWAVLSILKEEDSAQAFANDAHVIANIIQYLLISIGLYLGLTSKKSLA